MKIAPRRALWENLLSPRSTRALWVASSNTDLNCSAFLLTFWSSVVLAASLVSSWIQEHSQWLLTPFRRFFSNETYSWFVSNLSVFLLNLQKILYYFLVLLPEIKSCFVQTWCAFQPPGNSVIMIIFASNSLLSREVAKHCYRCTRSHKDGSISESLICLAAVPSEKTFW